MKSIGKFLVCASALACVSTRAAADEPKLSLRMNARTLTFTRSQLLARPDLKTLELKDDPTFPGRTMHYKAVPAAPLFAGLEIPADAIVQFRCLDGFSAPLARDRLLNTSKKGSIAYVAIEVPDESWPAIKPGASDTAGPFYLVWENAKASGIGQEEWPFQLAGFEVKASLRASFPHIFPDADVLANKGTVGRGFDVFRRNCFSCHTMNLEGESRVGPDLNLPMNPTEYFKVGLLKTLIRNPQNLRNWPQAKMPAFAENVLSARDLDDLIAYLRHMSGLKAR